MEQRKIDFISLINRFKAAFYDGSLNGSTEETIRGWINELLYIFGWNVQNTKQVLQERTLDKKQRSTLKSIGSNYVRPDYTFVNGRVKLSFLDAKSLDVNLRDDKSAAFQIRSYGWSIGAQFSIVTNMREFSIYDCSVKPNANDPANFARLYYFSIDEYCDCFDVFDSFLNREHVIRNEQFNLLGNREPIDADFANFLGTYRTKLVEDILRNNVNVTNISDLTLWAQIIIDRIVFVRVCEARGLEEDGLLLRFKDNGFWKSFEKSSYFEFYEHYDGPMFKRIKEVHQLKINNNVFEDLITHLYYPSPYRFDVIPLKTISDIYDRFLSYTLDISDGIVKEVLKDEYKKSNGAVTTPQHIVQNVISQTIDNETFHSMSLDDIFSIRIVDPACGSGAFLIELYEYISEVLKDYFRRFPNSIGNLAIIKDDEIILTIEGRKSIITNCIYGVDIDPEAVEVAKMSLSLKVIDDFCPEDFEIVGIHGSQILKGIGENIRNGNSLISSDILDYSQDLFENTSELVKTRIFDWHKTFPMVFANGGFDYVIGNPPYVEVKNYNKELPTMASYIKNRYPYSAKGKVDLSIPFIENGLNILNSHGRLGYIVQKRFFKTEYGEKIREYITTNNLLHSIYDYAENNLFQSRTTYVAILVFDKNTVKNPVIKYISSGNKVVLDIPQYCMSAKKWSLENIPLTILSQKLIRRIGTLENAFKVKVGIQVLWVNAYHIHVQYIKNGIIYGTSAIDDNVRIEVDACRKLVCNDQFVPMCGLGRPTYAIFPYNIDGGEKYRIPFSKYAKQFPLAGQYLAKHKDTITSNVQIQPERTLSLAIDEYWHIYTRENNIECRYPKVVIPMTTVYPQASVAEDFDVYCDNANVNYIQIPNGDKRILYAIAGIVNSRIFGILAYNGANPSNNGYRKYNKEFLNPVPFPSKAFAENDLRLNEISRIAQNIERIKKASSNVDRIVVRNLWGKIDEICRELYELSDEEWQLVKEMEDYER